MFVSRRKFVQTAVVSSIGVSPLESFGKSIAVGVDAVAPHPADARLRQQLMRIDQVMKTKGIQSDPTSHRAYFSGYSYKTLYDWDPYFEGIVQLELGWQPNYMINGLRIFLEFQREDGYIRRVNDPTPREESDEMFKPFMAQISLLITRRLGNLKWMEDNDYQRMKKFLLYWLTNLSKDGGKLSYWRSAPHTGMDTQHERAGHWKADFSNGVDLNSYLYRECLAFALIAESRGHADDAAHFRAQAEIKKKAIQEQCWNDKDGFYYDVDNRTGQQIPVKSVAGFAPLWAGIPTHAQAETMVKKHLLNPAEFWRKFPIPSLAATEKGYTEEYLPTDVHGSLWRANTWIPTNYYTFHGLRNYGYNDLAAKLANITYDNVSRIGDYEYYTSDSVAGAGLAPFWGWSLLAYFMPWENANNYDPTALTITRPIVSAL